MNIYIYIMHFSNTSCIKLTQWKLQVIIAYHKWKHFTRFSSYNIYGKYKFQTLIYEMAEHSWSNNSFIFLNLKLNYVVIHYSFCKLMNTWFVLILRFYFVQHHRFSYLIHDVYDIKRKYLYYTFNQGMMIALEKGKQNSCFKLVSCNDGRILWTFIR